MDIFSTIVQWTENCSISQKRSYQIVSGGLLGLGLILGLNELRWKSWRHYAMYTLSVLVAYHAKNLGLMWFA